MDSVAPNSSAPLSSGSSRSLVVHAPRWDQKLLARVLVALVRLITSTLRYHWLDRSDYFKNGSPGPAIFCVWHNRLALSMKAYFSYARKYVKSPRLAALVSASKDGGFLAAVLQGFGVQPVRGSSSRRGSQAILELTSWAERGYDLAITPDGPRGPRYLAQEGAIALAQLTGHPIVPASMNVRWKIQLKSWDRFQIPLPFSYCEVTIEKPIYVPREASDQEREQLRLKLQETLRSISNDC